MGTQGSKPYSVEDLAVYVAINTPTIGLASELPSRGGPGTKVQIIHYIGDLAIDMSTLPLVRGADYAYNCNVGDPPIQGLTKFSTSDKLLNASMAPDQYFLGEDKVELTPEAINELAEFGFLKRMELLKNQYLMAIDAVKQSKTPSSEEEKQAKISALENERQKEIAALEDKEAEIILEIQENLKKLTFNEAMLPQIDQIYSVLMGKRAQTEKFDIPEVARPLREIIGRKHITAISQNIGVKNSGTPQPQYAVFTIGGPDRSEASGFGVLSHQAVDTSAHQVTYVKGIQAKENISLPTVALYQGHNPNISQQMVIQSKGLSGVDGKNRELNITGSDFEKIVRFYENTMKKGVPVVVNCTDGIDRTGMSVMALALLHEFNKGNDITNKSEKEQKAELVKMMNSLKQDRGPHFLRSTKDCGIAVIFGYSLIAAQKQMNFQRILSDRSYISPELQDLAKNAESMEPEDLRTELNKLKETVTLEDVKFVDEWLNLIDSRIAVTKQFTKANEEQSDLEIRLSEPQKKKKGTGGKMYNAEEALKVDPIHTAPISKYNELIKAGFDLGAYKRKSDNHTIYHFAVDTLLKNPSVENLKEMSELIKNGKSPAIRAVEQALVEKGIHPQIIGMVLQVLEDKNSVEAIKSELSNLGVEERKKLLLDISNLSKSSDKNSKKIFKQLKDALPSESKARQNDKALARANPPPKTDKELQREADLISLRAAAKAFTDNPTKDNLDKMVKLEQKILPKGSIVDILVESGLMSESKVKKDVSNFIKTELKKMGSKQKSEAIKLLKHERGNIKNIGVKGILREIEGMLPKKSLARKNDIMIKEQRENYPAGLSEAIVKLIAALEQAQKIAETGEGGKYILEHSKNLIFPEQRLFSIKNQVEKLESNINNKAVQNTALKAEVLEAIKEFKKDVEKIEIQAGLVVPKPVGFQVSPSLPPEVGEALKSFVSNLRNLKVTPDIRYIFDNYIAKLEFANVDEVNKIMKELKDHSYFSPTGANYKTEYGPSVQKAIANVDEALGNIIDLENPQPIGESKPISTDEELKKESPSVVPQVTLSHPELDEAKRTLIEELIKICNQSITLKGETKGKGMPENQAMKIRGFIKKIQSLNDIESIRAHVKGLSIEPDFKIEGNVVLRHSPGVQDAIKKFNTAVDKILREPNKEAASQPLPRKPTRVSIPVVQDAQTSPLPPDTSIIRRNIMIARGRYLDVHKDPQSRAKVDLFMSEYSKIAEDSRNQNDPPEKIDQKVVSFLYKKKDEKSEVANFILNDLFANKIIKPLPELKKQVDSDKPSVPITTSSVRRVPISNPEMHVVVKAARELQSQYSSQPGSEKITEGLDKICSDARNNRYSSAKISYEVLNFLQGESIRNNVVSANILDGMKAQGMDITPRRPLPPAPNRLPPAPKRPDAFTLAAPNHASGSPSQTGTPVAQSKTGDKKLDEEKATERRKSGPGFGHHDD